MDEGIVRFKGSKQGLQLIISDNVDFTAVLTEVRDKLQSGSGFFGRGTIVNIPLLLPEQEKRQLSQLFHEYGLVMSTIQAAEPTESKKDEVVQDTKQPEVQEMTVINRTLRGGEEIRSKSSVLVCGNVNPGAQIIAGGSIDIRGTCRGLVHAGAFGDTKAFIIADHLMPMQIRIADLIARAPDKVESSDCAERASVRDGMIIIEPIER